MSSSAFSNHVRYVHCHFCSTILAVSVPGTNLCTSVTVRCGHCATLLSVYMGALPQSFPFLQDLQDNFQGHNLGTPGLNLDCQSSAQYNRFSLFSSMDSNKQEIIPNHAPEKRRRVPSAYNSFIKEEIRRLKATIPDISHRQAFSTAAKNWAHFPRIHLGLNLDGSKQEKGDEPIISQGDQKSQGYF